MRILFVCTDFFKLNGSGNMSHAYLNALKMFPKGSEVIPFLFPSIDSPEENEYRSFVLDKKFSGIDKAKNTILYGDPLVSKKVKKELIKKLYEEEIDIVFLMRSTLGCLVKLIKKNSNAMIITYNPDVYLECMKGKWKGDKKLFLRNSLVYLRWIRYDRISAKKSDANIVLNERDYQGFVRCYNREPDLIIPIFCVDQLDLDYTQRQKSNEKFVMIFIGSLFWPNVEGIKWFINNVMPFLMDGVELQVIGNRMQELRDEPEFQKNGVNLIGTVDSTTQYYMDADLVVAPIFDGTGMKTKTAEALMFGKEFLAAPEALTGYDGLEEHCCETAQEFIDRINGYVRNRPAKYNPELRKIFEDKYSIKAVSALLETLFMKVLEGK